MQQIGGMNSKIQNFQGFDPILHGNDMQELYLLSDAASFSALRCKKKSTFHVWWMPFLTFMY